MKIKMNVSISGTVDGERWPEQGGEIDINELEAERLIAGGLASPADSSGELETATEPEPETATAEGPLESATEPELETATVKKAPAKKPARKGPLTKETGPG